MLKYGPLLMLITGMHQLAASTANAIHIHNLTSVGNRVTFIHVTPPKVQRPPPRTGSHELPQVPRLPNGTAACSSALLGSLFIAQSAPDKTRADALLLNQILIHQCRCLKSKVQDSSTEAAQATVSTESDRP